MEIEAFLFFNENFNLGDAITCCNIRRQNQIREEFFQIKCICFKLYRYIYNYTENISKIHDTERRGTQHKCRNKLPEMKGHSFPVLREMIESVKNVKSSG